MAINLMNSVNLVNDKFWAFKWIEAVDGKIGTKQIALNHINHSALGDTYLNLLEAVKQTKLGKAELLRHSDEARMYYHRISRSEQIGKNTGTGTASNWITMSEISEKNGNTSRIY